MADIINVSSQDLQECVAKYTAAGAKLMQATATFSKALQALANDYTGRAFIIMSGKVASMVKNITTSYNRCLDAIKELGDVSQLFQETEDTTSKSYTSLDKGPESPFHM